MNDEYGKNTYEYYEKRMREIIEELDENVFEDLYTPYEMLNDDSYINADNADDPETHEWLLNEVNQIERHVKEACDKLTRMASGYTKKMKELYMKRFSEYSNKRDMIERDFDDE